MTIKLETHQLVLDVGKNMGKDPLTMPAADPEKPPQTTKWPDSTTLLTLSGFLGGSRDPAWIRLYLDDALNDYILVRHEDIIFWERRGVESAPKGQIDVIWVPD